MFRTRAAAGGAVLLVAFASLPLAARPDEGGAAPVEEVVARLGDAAKRAEASDELVRRGAAAVSALLPALADDTLRGPALDVIERIGPAAKDSVPALIPLVRRPSLPERAAVARALGAIGADALPAATHLVSYVREPRSAGREAAAEALGRIHMAEADRGRKPPTPGEGEAAVARGRDWLVRHQSAAGTWSCAKFTARCQGGACYGEGDPLHDVGVSGLATLALLGPVRPGDDPRFARAAQTALRAIAAGRDEKGFLAKTLSAKWVYSHHIAALALVEGLRTTGDEGLRAAATAAVAATAEAKNPYLAWRYGVRDGDNDTSVTTWASAVIAAARRTGVAVPRGDGYDGPLAWVDKMTDPENGRVGYQQRGGPSSRDSRMLERFPPERTESLTACGLRIRLDTGSTSSTDEFVTPGVELLLAKPPDWDESRGAIDLYYWAHGSEVLRRIGGEAYKSWRLDLLRALPPHQSLDTKSCERGSWEPCDPWSHEGGRVYSTAMAVLALVPCLEDPEGWPPLSAPARLSVAALLKVGEKAEDPLRTAALAAADRIRAVHRP